MVIWIAIKAYTTNSIDARDVYHICLPYMVMEYHFHFYIQSVFPDPL